MTGNIWVISDTHFQPFEHTEVYGFYLRQANPSGVQFGRRNE